MQALIDFAVGPGCEPSAAVLLDQRRSMRSNAPSAVASECEAETIQGRPHRINWARLPKRVVDIDMQHGPNCGAGELRIIAAVLERPVIEKILTHLGLDPQPPPRGRARESGHDFAA